MVTRRQSIALLAAGGAKGAPLDALDLPPELAAEIERDAAGSLRQARWLEDLPLEDLPPAFVYRP